jgi:hypothetical protein
MPASATRQDIALRWAKSVLGVSAVTSGQSRLTTAFAGVELAGEVKRFGLSGRYREVDDFRTGRFAWAADYLSWPLAEGLDRHDRWRMDASRRVHFLNSHEARTVAVTEAYIASRGYARQGNGANSTPLSVSTENGETCDLVAVTPPGGRRAVLWIGRRDRLVHRIDVQLSERIETFRYGNYRRIRGALLPFSITIDDGDEPATARIAISSYRFLAQVHAVAFEPPPERLGDARVSNGLSSHIPISIDRGTGFLIIFATVDGHPSMPFILDTGGHDIFTPAAARSVGLKVAGRGVSFGAGSGSTPTAFTSVDKITIGNAAMLAQPFTVLDLDLGMTHDANGRLVPIAGILGLEFFERFTVSLNFARGVAALALQSGAPKPGENALPLAFTSDVPLVNALLDGRAGSFSVDTGNNVGLIVYQRWLGERELPGIHFLSGAMGGSSVGGAVMFRHARADSLLLGATRIDSVRAFIADAHAGSMSSRSEAGNIGVTVLSHFFVTFDYRGGTMTIRR